jgi:hypothetical protein
MNLQVERYEIQRQTWPDSGRHILAQFDADSIVIYQAYNPSIGRFAAQHGYFGGKFSYTRMSWCKPNFLWMMYRSGWGTKEGQEVTLAIRLKRPFFDLILSQAVPSSYTPQLYPDEAAWSQAVATSDVRLQWDPDHAPDGTPVERRAIQLGLRGRMLEEYGREAILQIEDMSEFVAEQRANKDGPELVTPLEQVYRPTDLAVAERLRLSEWPKDA